MIKVHEHVSCEPCGVSALITEILDLAYLPGQREVFLAAGGCAHARRRADVASEEMLRKHRARTSTDASGWPLRDGPEGA